MYLWGSDHRPRLVLGTRPHAECVCAHQGAESSIWLPGHGPGLRSRGAGLGGWTDRSFAVAGRTNFNVPSPRETEWHRRSIEPHPGGGGSALGLLRMAMGNADHWAQMESRLSRLENLEAIRDS